MEIFEHWEKDSDWYLALVSLRVAIHTLYMLEYCTVGRYSICRNSCMPCQDHPGKATSSLGPIPDS